MSLFKEVALTPHVFDKNKLLDNERKFEKLLNALEGLSESGMLVGVYSNWYENINKFIEAYDDFDKDEMEGVLKHLHDRQRIVHVQNQLCDKDDEECWISQATKLNQIRAFEIILATQQNYNTKSLDEIDRKTLKDAFQNKGAKVLPQTKENMQKLLMSILAYAEIAKVYDPYFNLSKKRYEDALNIVCQTLGSHHGAKETAIIDIHTSAKTLLNNIDMLDWSLSDNWSSKIRNFQKLYGHQIVIHVWEDKRGNDEWHDRWLITNQCGITLGKGSDISEWHDATWGILDYVEIPNLECKFDSNNNKYNHIALVNASGLKKDKPLRQHSELKTPQEQEVDRQKHLAEIKKEEERREATKNNPTITTASGIRKKLKIFS